jgi:phosphoglycolate phosphatase-like HAD superfamily hydrolase
MPVCAVTYGYGTVENLTAWRPDFVVDSLHKLLE